MSLMWLQLRKPCVPQHDMYRHPKDAHALTNECSPGKEFSMKTPMKMLLLGMMLVGFLGGCAGFGTVPISKELVQQERFLTDAELSRPPLLWH